MKRTIIPAFLVSFLAIFTAISLLALEVDVDEVKSKQVRFINYRGKKQKSDPPKAVSAIGRGLARGARARGKNRKYSFHRKYSIVRAVSKKEPEKFSADIFFINKSARVTHINYVRKITAGYLAKMYGYSPRQARTLALFLSYYNAIHRGDVAYFSEKYKSVVMKHISAKNAGISTKYYEWPGKTRILIPLTTEAKRGKLDSIDPDIISGKDTRDEVRKDDKNLDERKDMVDLKEKIIEKDKEDIEEKKKDTAEKKREVEKEKREAAKKREDLEKKKTAIKEKEEKIAEEKEEAKTITDPEEKETKEEEIKTSEKEVAEEKKEAKETEEKITEEEKKTEKKEDDIKTAEKEVTDKETSVKKKEEGLKEEKKEIEEDELKKDIKDDPEKAREKLEKKADTLEEKEKDLDKREEDMRDKTAEKKVFALKLYYMKVKEYLEKGHYNNDLYMINAVTGKIDFKSPVKNICGNKYSIFADGIVVITHQGKHSEGHSLTLIDRKTLKTTITGAEGVFWRSFVEIREGFIYAIIFDNGKFYLGKFDKELKQVARSDVQINENTFISIYDDKIFINRHDKQIIVLNKEDLKFVKEIKP
ncbi:MAG: hypothetical protein GY754_35500 [bacterium]|nr:hypothetical protein [bacterium]